MRQGRKRESGGGGEGEKGESVRVKCCSVEEEEEEVKEVGSCFLNFFESLSNVKLCSDRLGL